MEYHQWLLHFRTKFNINIFAQIFIGKNQNYLLLTDKRTDVWSRNFIIWEINFGLWADARAGPWEKGVWADSE
jgi:hypothetical protein